MARKKVMMSIYLRPDQSEALRRLQITSGTPVAEYIRRGVDIVLQQEAQGAKKLPAEQQALVDEMAQWKVQMREQVKNGARLLQRMGQGTEEGNVTRQK